MKRIAIIVVALLAVSQALAGWDEDYDDLRRTTQQTQQLNRQAPTATPQRQQQIREQVSQNLGTMDAIADRNQNLPEAQKAVTDAFLDVGEPTRAERTGKRRLALTPKDPDAWVQMSRVYYDQGDYKRSINAAAYAQRLDPANAAAMAMLKLAEGRSGQMKPPKPDASALGGGGEAPREQPKPEPAAPPPGAARPSLEQAAALVEKDPAAALRMAETVIVTDPSDPAAHLVAAQARLRGGDAKGAALEAEQVQRLGGDKSRALDVAAKAQLALGNAPAALREAGRALALDPRDPRALVNRALARIRMGESSEALAELKKAFEAGDVPAYDYDRLAQLAGVSRPAAGLPDQEPAQPAPARRPWLLVALAGGAALVGAGLLARRKDAA